MPSTLLLLFKSSILFNNTTSGTFSSNLINVDSNPISAQFFTLLATYVSLAPLLPIKIAARCGGRLLLLFISSACFVNDSFIAADATFPSKINMAQRYISSVKTKYSKNITFGKYANLHKLNNISFKFYVYFLFS